MLPQPKRVDSPSCVSLAGGNRIAVIFSLNLKGFATLTKAISNGSSSIWIYFSWTIIFSNRRLWPFSSFSVKRKSCRPAKSSNQWLLGTLTTQWAAVRTWKIFFVVLELYENIHLKRNCYPIFIQDTSATPMSWFFGKSHSVDKLHWNNKWSGIWFGIVTVNDKVINCISLVCKSWESY